MDDSLSPNSRRGAIQPEPSTPEAPSDAFEAPTSQPSPVRRPVERPLVSPSVTSIDGMVKDGEGRQSLIAQSPVTQAAPPQPVVASRQLNPDTTEPETLEVPPLPAEPPAPKKPRRFRRTGLIGLALIVLLVSGYVAYDMWQSEQRTQAVVSGDGNDSTAPFTIGGAEGIDETPITPNILADYKVAADAPRALYINKLSVAARVMPMALNGNGSIQAPKNIFDAGWYTSSAKPGVAGATFIDAHASGATREGLFAYLDTLAVGDTLQLEKGDGQKLTYRVTHVETVPLDQVDMNKALAPYDGATSGMNLMTCTGKWIQDKQTYDKRAIVYTELIS